MKRNSTYRKSKKNLGKKYKQNEVYNQLLDIIPKILSVYGKNEIKLYNQILSSYENSIDEFNKTIRYLVKTYNQFDSVSEILYNQTIQDLIETYNKTLLKYNSKFLNFLSKYIQPQQVYQQASQQPTQPQAQQQALQQPTTQPPQVQQPQQGVGFREKLFNFLFSPDPNKPWGGTIIKWQEGVEKAAQPLYYATKK
jgi:predicted DNA-binding protein YlxM (UPF0122 family)